MTASLRPTIGRCPVCGRDERYLSWRRVPHQMALIATCLDSIGCGKAIVKRIDRKIRNDRARDQRRLAKLTAAARAAGMTTEPNESDLGQ